MKSLKQYYFVLYLPGLQCDIDELEIHDFLLIQNYELDVKNYDNMWLDPGICLKFKIKKPFTDFSSQYGLEVKYSIVTFVYILLSLGYLSSEQEIQPYGSADSFIIENDECKSIIHWNSDEFFFLTYLAADDKHAMESELLSNAKNILIQLESHPYKEHIKRAIRWAWEGNVNEDPESSIIKYCISLEALYGYSIRRGKIQATILNMLSEKLGLEANQTYDLAYSLRCKLVHEGHADIKNWQILDLQNDLKKLLEAAIIAEIKN